MTKGVTTTLQRNFRARCGGVSRGDGHGGQFAGAGNIVPALWRDILPCRKPYRGGRMRRAGIFHVGAKLVTLEGATRNSRPQAIEAALPQFPARRAQPQTAVGFDHAGHRTRHGLHAAAKSQRSPTARKKHNMKLHMDGARFANALAHLKCAPPTLHGTRASMRCRSAPRKTARSPPRRSCSSIKAMVAISNIAARKAGISSPRCGSSPRNSKPI